MDSLIYLIPVAVGLGALGLAAFLWAMTSGQFDDPDGAASRILFDDVETPRPKPRNTSSRSVP
ncbi:MAG: cbb3-type cytochrome oxidase assembly protein CcoS [Alphaproteobacteria bacterium]|nr:cbb3-type cytochrome oxidase assembly protein CcoS [Alphaproteobacteria bacterium]